MALSNNISHLIYIIFSPVISTFFVFLNIVSIVIFVRKFRLASLPLVILVNICVCDIFVCLLSNNFYVINLIHPTYAWNTGAISCKFFKTLTMACNLSQIYSFVILCFDRMRRLMQTTERQWKKTHGVMFLLLAWCMSIAITGGRLVIFDLKEMTKFDNSTNMTQILNLACKPLGINTTMYAAMTIVQFIVGYLMPLMSILSTVMICEFHIHRVFNRKILAHSNSQTLSMNRQLSMVFNLTALLFLGIWTPFFIMSVIDLKINLLGDKSLTHLNFAFRCTLLVVGSGKPLIYMIGLKRYRSAFFDGMCTRKRDVSIDSSHVETVSSAISSAIGTA